MATNQGISEKDLAMNQTSVTSKLLLLLLNLFLLFHLKQGCHPPESMMHVVYSPLFPKNL